VICSGCDLGHADTEIEDEDGVTYLLCPQCALQFTHPSWLAKPTLRSHQLAEMCQRHGRTEELTSR
jgi:hypothetical protein